METTEMELETVDDEMVCEDATLLELVDEEVV